MNSKDFINTHIENEEELKISMKLYKLASKHREYSRYLDMVQKKPVSLLFYILHRNYYLYFSLVCYDIQDFNYKKWIKNLIFEDFIDLCDNDEAYEVTKDLDVPRKPKVYKLTQKGKDFVNIDYISKYLVEVNE